MNSEPLNKIDFFNNLKSFTLMDYIPSLFLAAVLGGVYYIFSKKKVVENDTSNLPVEEEVFTSRPTVETEIVAIPLSTGETPTTITKEMGTLKVDYAIAVNYGNLVLPYPIPLNKSVLKVFICNKAVYNRNGKWNLKREFPVELGEILREEDYNTIFKTTEDIHRKVAALTNIAFTRVQDAKTLNRLNNRWS